jgi:4-hydroxyphenylpyruvate dioxygenase
MSLGRCFAGHSLSHKLDMARKYGYQGIEFFHEDLLDIAEGLGDGGASGQIDAARIVRRLCTERNLQIICLQPFMHYEGLRDREEHRRRIDKMKLWFHLARELRTDVIQIPSTFLRPDEISGDLDLIVQDMTEVAEMGLRETPVIRFVYESLAWGTYVNTWEQCWEVVRRVDRPNFGICLDTFNIAARIYGDPASCSGMTANAEKAVHESMARLIKMVDLKKVFYVQVVDAERLSEPIQPGHQFYHSEQPARMSWSRNCRLFYGEQDRGAYLPVKEISHAIFSGLGFQGWVSLELFNRRMSDADKSVPEELAMRGAISWNKLVKDVGLKVEQTDSHADLRPSL